MGDGELGPGTAVTISIPRLMIRERQIDMSKLKAYDYWNGIHAMPWPPDLRADSCTIARTPDPTLKKLTLRTEMSAREYLSPARVLYPESFTSETSSPTILTYTISIQPWTS